MYCLLLCAVEFLGTASANEFRDKNFSIWKMGDEKSVSAAEMIFF